MCTAQKTVSVSTMWVLTDVDIKEQSTVKEKKIIWEWAHVLGKQALCRRMFALGLQRVGILSLETRLWEQKRKLGGSKSAGVWLK